jgi:hypothetical protein
MYDFTQAQIKDLAFFDGHLQEFMNDMTMRFKHVIISNMKVVGVFDNIEQAVQHITDNNLKRGEYILQQIVDEEEMVNFV